MEKPIIVKLGTGSTEDQVEYIENGETKQRMGLCKQISSDFLHQPFRDLISYVCNPLADELNCAYSASETEVAQRIEALVGQGDVVIDASKENNYQITGIELETIVGDKYKQIVQIEEIHQSGQTVPVQSLDLMLTNRLGGGWYRK